MKSHLSATAPETMVAAVAAKTYWKNHTAYEKSLSPLCAKCSYPTKAFPAPKAKAYPKIQ